MEEQLRAAEEKLNAEKVAHGTPQDMMRRLIISWLHYAPEDAAPRIMVEGKSIADCYRHIESEARKLNQSKVNASPEKELAWMLDYFGIEDGEAQSLIEGGLMYAVFQSLSEEWKPYGTGAAAPSAPASPAVPASAEKEAAPAFMSSLEDFL